MRTIFLRLRIAFNRVSHWKCGYLQSPVGNHPAGKPDSHVHACRLGSPGRPLPISRHNSSDLPERRDRMPDIAPFLCHVRLLNAQIRWWQANYAPCEAKTKPLIKKPETAGKPRGRAIYSRV